MKFYLRLEGVNFSSFVLDTEDLSTIRGGGLLLLDLPDRVMAEVDAMTVNERSVPVKLQRVSTGASQGLLSFEIGDAKAAAVGEGEIADAACRAVRTFLDGSAYRHATVVVDAGRVSGDFVKDRETLVAANRWRQWRQPTVAPPASQPGPDACSSDHLRPTAPHRVGKNDQPVSESVWMRRQYGKNQKQQFYRRFDDEAAVHGLAGEFVDDFERLSTSFEHSLSRKMGVIYLDGNGFGALRDKHCVSEEGERKFDQTVKDCQKRFMRRLLAEMRRDPRSWTTRDGRYRLETLLWGGDEIILVVPAWAAWPVLEIFYASTRGVDEDRSPWSVDTDPLTHAGGLVLCHHDAPIHRIRSLAMELADRVKAEFKGGNGEPRDAFGYLVLESFDDVGRELGEYLGERYGLVAGSISMALAGDSRMMALARTTVPAIRHVLPRRQLHRVVQQLRESPEAARATVTDLARVLGSDAGLLDELQPLLGGPWRLESPTATKSTQLDVSGARFWFHLAELWDYVGM